MSRVYTAEEREVHIWMDDIDRVWRADSSIPKYIRSFKRAGWKQIHRECDDNGREIFASFEAPDHALTIRRAERQKREMTDEQRAAASKRLAEARNLRNNTGK